MRHLPRPTTTPVHPIHPAQTGKPVRLVRSQQPGRGPAWYPGPAGSLRQRDPVVMMRTQHGQPTIQRRHQHTCLRPNQPPTSSRSAVNGAPGPGCGRSFGTVIGNSRSSGVATTAGTQATKVSHIPRPTTVLDEERCLLHPFRPPFPGRRPPLNTAASRPRRRGSTRSRPASWSRSRVNTRSGLVTLNS